MFVHTRYLMPTQPDKREIRGIVNKETAQLLRKLAGVSERSISSLLQEALDDLLSKPEYQEIIEYHKLDE